MSGVTPRDRLSKSMWIFIATAVIAALVVLVVRQRHSR